MTKKKITVAFLLAFGTICSNLVYSQSLNERASANFNIVQNNFYSQFFHLETPYSRSQLVHISKIQEKYKKQFLALRKAMLPHKRNFYRIITSKTVALNLAEKELNKISHYKIMLRMAMLRMRLEMEKILKHDHTSLSLMAKKYNRREKKSIKYIEYKKSGHRQKK